MLFVDESIQEQLGYICVGFAYCVDPPDAAVDAALLEAKLTPGVHEYKSGARTHYSTELHALRQRVATVVLEHCKIAVYVAPFAEREDLLTGVISTARQIVTTNGLSVPQAVFVDNGINGPVQRLNEDPTVFTAGCDSRQVKGIQLADYVAYHCSYLLKCELEGKSKTVRVEATPHPLADEQVELNWLLRTEVRRNFFTESRDLESIEGDDWFFTVRNFGSFYSERLPDGLRRAATRTFDEMYFGCVW